MPEISLFYGIKILMVVLAWTELHKDELMQNWELAKAHKPLNRINPLI